MNKYIKQQIIISIIYYSSRTFQIQNITDNARF